MRSPPFADPPAWASWWMHRLEICVPASKGPLVRRLVVHEGWPRCPCHAEPACARGPISVAMCAHHAVARHAEAKTSPPLRPATPDGTESRLPAAPPQVGGPAAYLAQYGNVRSPRQRPAYRYRGLRKRFNVRERPACQVTRRWRHTLALERPQDESKAARGVNWKRSADLPYRWAAHPCFFRR
jgi:hypothetical protein